MNKNEQIKVLICENGMLELGLVNFLKGRLK